MTNLGQEMKNCCEPMGPMTEASMHYPHLHIESDVDLDLPEKGTATVKFRMVSHTEEYRNGKAHYRCELDVLAIGDVKGTNSKKSSTKETEEALDSLANEAEKEY